MTCNKMYRMYVCVPTPPYYSMSIPTWIKIGMYSYMFRHKYIPTGKVRRVYSLRRSVYTYYVVVGMVTYHNMHPPPSFCEHFRFIFSFASQ
jgi:hypothetical protein